jgi:hypothetical protein
LPGGKRRSVLSAADEHGQPASERALVTAPAIQRQDWQGSTYESRAGRPVYLVDADTDQILDTAILDVADAGAIAVLHPHGGSASVARLRHHRHVDEMSGGRWSWPPREKVLAAYADGLQAIERYAQSVADWSAATPCAQWRAVDLAGHLLAIARYYHALLDAAEVGHHRTGLPRGDDLVAMNARDLARLPQASGPDRIADFLVLASAYGRRVAEADWDRVLGEWNGARPLTLAQHTGLAIGEWHLHAWDLAQTVVQDHRPADAVTVAAGRAARPEPMPVGDPWLATLTLAGRRPATSSRG